MEKNSSSNAITYRLFVSITLYAMVGFFLVLCVDAALPGFFAGFFSFFEAMTVLFILGGILVFLGSNYGYMFKKTPPQKYFLSTSAILAGMFIANATIKFGGLAMAVLIPLCVSIFILLLHAITDLSEE